MNILGINAYHGNASAAILCDGKLIAAVEEERFNRRKHGKRALVSNPDELPWRSIEFVLAGLYAILRLPVAQYPNVLPPTVQVTTRYPGASPADVLRSVALPIEQQVNGVQSMLYMQSTSAADGTYSLTVTL